MILALTILMIIPLRYIKVRNYIESNNFLYIFINFFKKLF